MAESSKGTAKAEMSELELEQKRWTKISLERRKLHLIKYDCDPTWVNNLSSTDLIQACLAAEGLQSSVALVLKPSSTIVHTTTVDTSITALLAQIMQMRADDKAKADAAQTKAEAAQAQFLQIRADDLLRAEAATKAAALFAQEQINLLADQLTRTSQSDF